MKTTTLSLLLASAALLAACGGGGGGGDAPAALPDPDAMNEMQAGAVATVQAFHGTLGAWTGEDRANPLGLDDVLPPTSDTAEPLALE